MPASQSPPKCLRLQSALKVPVRAPTSPKDFFFLGGGSRAPAVVAGAGAGAFGGGLAMAAQISGSAKDAWVPYSAMAAELPAPPLIPE